MNKWSMNMVADHIVFQPLEDDPGGSATEDAVARFRQMMDSVERAVVLIFDMSRLTTGYDADARKHWSDVVKLYQNRVERLVAVAASTALQRMAVSVVSLDAGIPLEHCSSLEAALPEGAASPHKES